MGKKWNFEYAFKRPRIVLYFRMGIAVVPRDFSGLFRESCIFFPDIGTAQVRERALVPFHFQGLNAF
jgi:hypothetical protein